MLTLPSHVESGDIISSDLMNAILTELVRLGGLAQAGGTEFVPNLLGLALGDARARILDPNRQLSMGFTLDAGGIQVDPIVTANSTRVVLNQYPLANSLVNPNTPVNLVVSGSSGASTPTPEPPVITGTLTIDGAASNSFAVGSRMVLEGSGFSSVGSQNLVSFDGVTVAADSVPGFLTRQIQVDVPSGIPGVPRDSVPVTVRFGTGPSNTVFIGVTNPAANQPTVRLVEPMTAQVNSVITITGTNLLSVTGVQIGGVDAMIGTDPTPTESQLSVTVPNLDIQSTSSIEQTLVLSGDAVDPVLVSDFRVFV